VVDVYSGWCGPCKAVQGLFRRVKNELGDDLLRFATVFNTIIILTLSDVLISKVVVFFQAKSDTIDALESYRERSEPTFLMYSVNP
jgi:thiol-disulfide isomerase/thioredoxin